MKTIVIWDQLGVEPLKFFVTDDKRFKTLDRVYINDSSAEPKKEKLLSRLIYDKDGNYLVTMLDNFPVTEVVSGVEVVVCGFLP